MSMPETSTFDLTENGELLMAVGECTCGQSGTGGPHEPTCGWELVTEIVYQNEYKTELDEALAYFYNMAATANEKLLAIRMVHQREQFGDCVEDGDPYPCKTIRVIDWTPPVVHDVTSLDT